VRRVWAGLGLRARLSVSIGAIVLAAFLAVFVAVRVEFRDERGPAQREARTEVERAVLIGGGVALAGALLAGYLVAAAFERTLSRLDEALLRQRRFVSDASHELRTPLTAVRGQLEVLARDDPDPAEVRRVGGVVLEELGRIDRLVEDLLRLARLEEDAGLRLERIDPAVFLGEIAAEGSFGPIEVGRVPVGVLEADPEALRQVLRNLLGNARRHAGAGGRIAIGATARGSRLTICVDDDGPGIPSAERQRVFDRFHRSDAGRGRRSGGAGLGLAIARSIVALHGGRIWAEDSPLGGARVAFELENFHPAVEV